MPVFRGQPELLRRFRAGDRAAMEEVYWAFVDKVEGIFRFGFLAPTTGRRVPGMARNANDVEDVLQETFARAFSEISRMAFDGLRDFGPYLFAIARSALADWGRKSGRELPAEWFQDAMAELPAPLPEEEVSYADADTMAVVHAYLKTLPEAERRVHQALYVQCLPQRTAAEELGLTRQKLRTLDDHIRSGLRRALKRRALGPS